MCSLSWATEDLATLVRPDKATTGGARGASRVSLGHDALKVSSLHVAGRLLDNII